MKLDLGQPDLEFNSNILDVVIPRELEKSISTGHGYIDQLFAGDGIVPSTTAIITGEPGSGKTTLMLQAANLITRTGHTVLYNTGEESLYQIRRHAMRLNLRHGFIPGYSSNVDEIIAHMDELRKAYPDRQLFLIQDSVQCLQPSNLDPESGEKKKGRKKTGLMAQLDAVISLSKYAKEHYVIILFINQLTKDGKMAGLNGVKHLVDCHLHLGRDTDKSSNFLGERVMEMEKNRFGIANQSVGFEIFEDGIRFRKTDTSCEVSVPAEQNKTEKLITLDEGLSRAFSGIKTGG